MTKITSVLLETKNFRVEKNEDGKLKFSELQRDNRGQVFPVQLKTVQDYHTLATELTQIIEEMTAAS